MTSHPIHAAFEGGDPSTALQEIRHVIEHQISNEPRSLQETIGPSQLGTDCDHCLAAQLAGWTESRDIAWLPTIGTAVHRLLEEYVINYENARNANHTTGRRWLTEQRVTVGRVDGVDITGSTDLIDLITGMIIDWKITGANTLKDVKANGPAQQYRIQANLYAKGWNDAGIRIDHIAIAYLPRNSQSLRYAYWFTEPYNEQVAVDALERADKIAKTIKTLRGFTEDAVTKYVHGLARATGCYQCARYADSPTANGAGQFAGISAGTNQIKDCK